MNRRSTIVFSIGAALVLLAGAASLSTPAASASIDTQTQAARDALANCQLLANSSTGVQQQRALECVADQTRTLQLLGVSPTPTTPTTTNPPATVPPSTTSPPIPSPTPTTPPPSPQPSSFPNGNNTGVPAGVSLTPWTGSCVITLPVVIVGRVFNCNVSVRSANVQILRSRINGWIDNTDRSGTSFSLVDSEVAMPGVQELTGVGNHDFTLLRVEVTGGNRGVYCARTCDIRDSWIHGQKIQGLWHASAVRMEQGLTLVHNTLVCDAPVQSNPEGSCSASLTGYGDYAPVQNNLIQGNLFTNTVYAAYCAYGGSSRGKPYSGGVHDIRFIDNVFQRPCALYGPIGDWDPSRPGNVWQNNRYEDGTIIPNRNSVSV